MTRGSLASLALLSLLASTSLAAERDVRTSEIVKETLRTDAFARRVVNFWWLPVEYWVAAARELGQEEKDIAEVRGLFRNYIVLAALDAEVKPDGSFQTLSTLDIVRRLEVEVDGKPVPVLHEVHSRLQELIPALAYVLQASLGRVSSGLRILPLRGVDEQGNVLMSGVVKNRMKITYRADDTVPAIEFFWRSPVTAVVGAKQCPGSGERMEAHWQFCPWTGQRVP